MKRIVIILFCLMVSISLNAQTNDCKCCTAKHSEFDFWIGTWNITNPDGTAAGKNLIEKIQDQCLLRENWKSAKGSFTGTSNNFYNFKTDQWEQIWLDNQGAAYILKEIKLEIK